MHEVWHSPCGRMELRLGRWQDVLSDVTECDAVITDPPYSERTHAGQRTGSSTRTPTISYEPMTYHHALELAESWAERVKFWAILFSDHMGSMLHSDEWSRCGWYTFAPLPYVKDVYAPRLAGDGPANGCEWISVFRPRRRVPTDRSGSRPGWYMAKGRYSCDRPAGIAGQKDAGVMRTIVQDYSRPGDLIVDPYAGSGTTLLAAAMEGRRCIGAEVDPDTFALAVKRLSKGYTESLFGRGEKPNLKQRELL